MGFGLALVGIGIAVIICQLYIANSRAKAIEKILSNLEYRIFSLEKDVHRRLTANGIDPIDVNAIHPLYPPRGYSPPAQ